MLGLQLCRCTTWWTRRRTWCSRACSRPSRLSGSL